MSIRTIKIDDVTQQAVRAALAVIDEATDETTHHSDSPCGDTLAVKLDKLIREALTEHMRSDCAPAFVTATDLDQD